MDLGALQQKLRDIYPHHRGVVISCDADRVVLMQAVQTHDLRFGDKVNGPAIMELVDVAGFCAAVSILAAAEDAVTVNLNIDFLAPCATETLHCNADLIKVGRRLITVEASVFDDHHVLCARSRMIYARISHSRN